MKTLKINRVIDLLIEASYLAIVFFVPLYFALFLKTANVFGLNKMVLFRILILFLLWFTVVKVVMVKRLSKNSSPCHPEERSDEGSRESCVNSRDSSPASECGVRMTAREFSDSLWRYAKYLIIPLLFLLSIALATLFSIDPETSIYGLYDRQQGLISQAYYFLFFILLIINVRNAKQVRRIIITAFLSSLFVCAYGLVQAAGFDPLNWNESTSLRVTSTLGQPNFLASYLLLIIPLSIYLFFTSKKLLIKFLILIVFLFQLLCLYLTYSLSGWLSLILGSMVTAIICLVVLKKRLSFEFKKLKQSFSSFLESNTNIFFHFLRRHKGFVVAAIFVPLFISLVFSAVMLGSDTFLLARLKHSFSPKHGSSAQRLNFWQASIDAIQQRPLLGYGPETQGEILAKYYEKDWMALLSKINSYPNRAHNIIFDTLLTCGFVGLIIYLALLYLFFKLIIGNIKKNNNRLLSLMIFAGLVSYLISLMFGFSVISTDVYFWLYLAIIVVIYLRGHGFNADIPTFAKATAGEGGFRPTFAASLVKTSDVKKAMVGRSGSNAERGERNWRRLIYLVLVVIVGVAVIYQSKKEVDKLIADHYFRELQQAWVNEEYFKAYTLYSYIKEKNVRDHYYDWAFGIMLAGKLDQMNILSLKKPGQEILENITTAITGEKFFDNYATARIFTTLANKESPDFYGEAEAAFARLISFNPNIPANYSELARMYYKKGEHNQAIHYYQKTLEIMPNINDLRELKMEDYKKFIYIERANMYNNIGNIYTRLGVFDKAEENYWLAYKHNPDDITIYKRIADVYYRQNDFDKAIWYNKRGYMRNPKDYAWPFAIAFLYKEQGDNIKALEFSKIALELSSNNEQIKNFIQDINP